MQKQWRGLGPLALPSHTLKWAFKNISDNLSKCFWKQFFFQIFFSCAVSEIASKIWLLLQTKRKTNVQVELNCGLHNANWLPSTYLPQAQKEAAEAEEMARELGLNDKSDDSLKQLIMKRQQDRQGAMDDMIAGLEAKYCKPKKQKTSKGKKKWSLTLGWSSFDIVRTKEYICNCIVHAFWDKTIYDTNLSSLFLMFGTWVPSIVLSNFCLSPLWVALTSFLCTSFLSRSKVLLYLQIKLIINM